MSTRDFKYLLAYLLPLAAYAGFYFGGYWSFGAMYLAFVILPALETILPQREDNPARETEATRSRLRFFDFLLYLNLPLLYLGIGWFVYLLAYTQPTTLELVGYTFNLGVLIGTIGINVGHELGHRSNRYEQWMAQALLLPGLYQHFFIEHNRGHHKHVATPVDPASARRGETLYAFWLRSTIGQWLAAWRLENQRLEKADRSTFSLRNLMLRFQLMNLLYLGLAAAILGWSVALGLLAAGVVGFLLLETVNYIEHYGLSRKQLPSGRYEPVRPIHSWNSNHEMGRIFLYELTRHSDHHFKSTRKYQILRSHEESPLLPAGYPGCMLMSLVPPLWFRMVDAKIDEIQQAA